ncbi:putative transcriptional regulator [Desulforapulum autotrophicum HRM2]|uniref:Transcriptional regulator n=2 Tax=Desulforapulum autotrophicum TaxID=2296 RepID=C0QH95_DESAH|nr:putative transcriptional regulator [Desulforapulum autotrophicum HRM2]
MQFSPIKSVTEATACRLREQIVTGGILPGTKLNEIELAESYGVSRPPLREAFRKLEQEQLVVSIPRRGSYVTKISVKDCTELYFTRCVLESGAIDAIAEKKIKNFAATEKHLNDLKNIIVYREGEPSNLFNSIYGITAFHLELFEASGNQWLLHCYKNIISTLNRYQYIYFSVPGTQLPSIVDHTKVLNFLKKKQYQDAKIVILEHINNSFSKLIETIKESSIMA